MGLQKEIKRLESRLVKVQQSNKDVTEEAEICNALGELYYENGEYTKAVKTHQRELILCEALGDKIGIAIANRKIGENLCELKQFDEALKHEKRHLHLAKEASSLVEEQRALATIGRTYFLEAEHHSNDEKESSYCLSMAHQAYLDSLGVCDMLVGSVVEHELQQMRARLYLNLGLVFENKQEAIKAIKYTHKSLTIARDYKLRDTEYRALYSLGGMYAKSNDYFRAKEMFSMALNSDQVKDDAAIESEILEFLGQALLKLENFTEAKCALKKSYKLRCEDSQSSSRLRLNYKLASKALELRKQLTGMESLSDNERLQLMEQLGDVYCKIGIVDSAIDFYKKQLSIALSLGIEGSDLAAIYVSLALSYTDAKCYKDAIEAYENELKTHCRTPKEECCTWLNVAQLLEDSSHNFTDICEKYDNALRCARQTNDVILIIKVLRALADTQGAFSRTDLQAKTHEEIRQLMDEQDIHSDDSDLEDKDNCNSDPMMLDSEDSISDSDVSECIEEYDKLLPGAAVTHKRKRLKRCKEKVNDKGETPLHVATIKGDLKVVKALVEQGVNVNSRDNCGWSPLHEACNFGYKDIAEYLLEHGADVNSCVVDAHWGMVTPLLDAMQNCHLDTVKMLLDNGASLSLSPEEARTLLARLENEMESESEEDNYEDEIARKEIISIARKVLGIPVCTSENGNQSVHLATVSDAECDTNIIKRSSIKNLRKRKVKSRSSSEIIEKIEKNRLRDDLSDMDSDAVLSECSTSSSSVYVLEDDTGTPTNTSSRSLGNHKNCRSEVNGKTSTLISEHEYDVDWLIDDLREGTIRKKRKTRSVAIQDQIEIGNDIPKRRRARTNTVQTVITDYSALNDSVSEDGSDNNRTSDFNENEGLSLNHQNTTTVMRVRVRIQDKTFLIPCGVRSEQKTVSWLLDQASNRYFSSTGMRPSSLVFSNKQGALLSPEDCLFDVVSSNEEVVASVDSWDLPPLQNHYISCCQNLGVEPHPEVILAFDSNTRCQNIDIQNYLLYEADILPIAQVLQGHTLLTTLVLSGNCIGDKGFKYFAPILKTLHNLVTFDLSNNGITHDGLNFITDCLFSEPTSSTRKTSLGKLQELNLSFNPLNDLSCIALASILNNCKRLVKLYLESCMLSSHIMQPRQGFKDGLKDANGLQCLSLSKNNLGCVGVQELLISLPCSSITWLSLNSVGLDFRQEELAKSIVNYTERNGCALKKLELADNCMGRVTVEDFASMMHRLKSINLGCCSIPDKFVYSIARYLPSSKITQLVLQGNPEITKDGLRTIIASLHTGHKQLELLDLSSCGITSPLQNDIFDMLLMPLSGTHECEETECITKDFRLSYNRINATDKEEFCKRWIKGWGVNQAKKYINQCQCILYT